MLFRLVRPVKRAGSRYPFYVKRIPIDVRAKAVGLTLNVPLGATTQAITISPKADSVRLSLRTDVPSEVKSRQAAIDAYLERVWQALRNDAPLPLTHRQATALAGELYRSWANGEERERTTAMEHVPGKGWQPVHEDFNAEVWEAVEQHWANIGAKHGDLGTPEPRDLEEPLGPIINQRLLAKGIKRVDDETRAILLVAFWQAMRDAFASRRRNAEGDYSPDANSERFPEWKSPQATSVLPSSSAKVSLKGLVEAWWVEAKAMGRKPSTYDSYSNTAAAFAAFLKHDDAARITTEDVLAFKDHRLASINARTGKPISPKTVKDSDLAGLKTIFGWAVSNRKIDTNSAAGITLRLGKRRKLRSKGFTDAEAIAILTASRSITLGDERPETFAAKRWVPWLMAYTGARVGEMAQLRKEDFRTESGHWVANVTPEAGTVKTDEARDVALHPHLAEMGFTEFVDAAPSGHLFLTPSSRGGVRGPLKGLTNRLADFARTVVTDPNVKPNHGWRHRFKTIGRRSGIDQHVLDVIQGHQPRTDGEDYGDVDIQTQAAAIAKLPRYKIAP